MPPPTITVSETSPECPTHTMRATGDYVHFMMTINPLVIDNLDWHDDFGDGFVARLDAHLAAIREVAVSDYHRKLLRDELKLLRQATNGHAP